MGMKIIYTLILTFFIGWVANIIQIATADPFVFSGLMITKIIGIFLAPLGAILGIIGFF